jgi:hypothetical protein
MKKCKNCKINDARYICLECNREFCTICMKENEIYCSQCRFRKQEENEKKQQQQWKERQRENQFKLQKNNLNITKIINIIIASSILFLGIILVLASYPSVLNVSNISTNDGIISEEKIGNKNNNGNGFIYIFPFPFAIPLEFNTLSILPLIIVVMIIIPIIFFIIILKSIKIW